VQFYLDGFYPGDPEHTSVGDRPAPAHPATEVDVLIVGTGPAGLVLAAQLARFPEISTLVVERRPGPLELGQADGVACRSVEMFHAFGFSERLLREAYWVNETVFWGPDPADRSSITRGGRIQDVEDDLSEFPHVIVNQARIHSYLLDDMARSAAGLTPAYGTEFVALRVGGSGEHPVAVTLRDTETGAERVVRARYVVGCDGARSAVRTSIGRTLDGDSANQAWGVMDVLAITDFPDIRFKVAVQSPHGNMILIPREGGYLVRLYIELDKLAPEERVAARAITPDDIIAAARRILSPYTLEVREIVWWSVYEIGQRLTDRFDDVTDGDPHRQPRVFIAGDACHTHSPKAGQGMNVSMQDAFNLGWKLAAVLRGRSAPTLLNTYSAERRAIAEQLIDFDRDWARMLSTRPKDPDDPDGEGVTPEEFLTRFQASGRYTAGVATRYEPSVITGSGEHAVLARGFPIGERFHSAPVVRLADAKEMQLGHVAQADGRWRLYAFADALDPRDPASRFRAFAEALSTPDSPLATVTPAEADPDEVVDVRGIIQQSHHDLHIQDLPAAMRPRRGRLGLVDYEKAFTADLRGEDIFDARGIDRAAGCLVLVRPDQYVAHVLPLDGLAELRDFLAGFMAVAEPVR
jgi:phenol 2-monooxygenase